jgi:carboxyl-terminal processing protease
MRLKTKYFAVITAVLLSVVACKKEEIAEPENPTSSSPNADANGWIYDQMKAYYLWTDKLPEKSKTNLALDPIGTQQNGYFYSLLNDYPNTDRFSWIQQSVTELTNSLNGINKTTGMRYAIYYLDNTNTTVGFFVTYTIKGSPAEKAGLKRGDIVLTVNGVQLNGNNYTTAIQPDNLTFGLAERNGSNFVLNGKTVSVVKEEVAENPVHYSKVIEKEGKKIGYLVYNQFVSSYDNDLRNVFADFKAKGVSEMILDLRYNGGGFISSAVALSSLIGNVNSTQVAYRDEWNAAITKQYNASSFTKNFVTEPNSIGSNLKRLYVLTSKSSASASELVINMLRPYMEVILIGNNTYGKNVGSITLSDQNKRWNFGMQPIVLRTVNAKGESDYGTKTGFTPQYPVTDNVVPFKPFGDESETLLNKALSVIIGKPVSMSANARRAIIELDNPIRLNQSEAPALTDMFGELPKK